MDHRAHLCDVSTDGIFLAIECVLRRDRCGSGHSIPDTKSAWSRFRARSVSDPCGRLRYLLPVVVRPWIFGRLDVDQPAPARKDRLEVAPPGDGCICK